MVNEHDRHCGPQTLVAITRQRFWPLDENQSKSKVNQTNNRKFTSNTVYTRTPIY